MFTGQVFKRCKICQQPVLYYCTSCNIEICQTCVADHLCSPSDTGHNIVDYREKCSVNTFGQLRKEHCEKYCNTFCETCNGAICEVCSPDHVCHTLISKHKFIEHKIYQIKNLYKYMDPVKTEYELQLKTLRAEMKTPREYHDDTEEKINDMEESWHKIVDDIIRKLRSRLKLLRKTYRTDLIEVARIFERSQREADKLLEYIDHYIKNPHMLQSFTKFQPQNVPFVNENVEVFPYRSTASFDNALDSLISSFEEFESSSQKIINEFDTGYVKDKSQTVGMQGQAVYFDEINTTHDLTDIKIFLDSVLCCSDTSKFLKLYDEKGDVLFTKQLRFTPRRFETFSNIVLYTCAHNNGIIKMKDGIESVWLSDEHWYTTDLCCAESDVIVASQYHKSLLHGRVIKWNTEGEILQNITYISINKKLQPLLSDPRQLCINKNKDICVVYWKENRIIVLEDVGFVRFVYNGDSKSTFFIPRGVATNGQDHIFISDIINQNIHEIDPFGRFLRLISISSIDGHIFLSSDDTHNVWMAEWKTGLLKKMLPLST